MMKITRDLTVEGSPLRVRLDQPEVGPGVEMAIEECLELADIIRTIIKWNLVARQGLTAPPYAPAPRAEYEFLLYWRPRSDPDVFEIPVLPEVRDKPDLSGRPNITWGGQERVRRSTEA